MNCAKTADLDNDAVKRYGRIPHTTLKELFEAPSDPGNAAGLLADDDKEPWLFNLDAAEFDMFPFVPVYDVWVKANDDGTINVEPPGQTLRLEPGTLIYWR